MPSAVQTSGTVHTSGLRSNSCVLGLDGLRPREQLKVEVDSKVMCAAVHMVCATRIAGVPVVIESPATSRL